MLFYLLKHYLELYITNTALKVSRSLYCFTTSISHGFENYFSRLWGRGSFDAITMSTPLGVDILFLLFPASGVPLGFQTF